MPTYEYRCPDGHSFERFYRKISDAAPELACPQCGKLAERQLTGGAGLLFKGSGFYLTDYGKNAHRKGPPPSKPSGGEGGSGGSGGETKSERSGEGSSSSDAKPAASSSESSRAGDAPAAAKPTKPKSDQ